MNVVQSQLQRQSINQLRLKFRLGIGDVLKQPTMNYQVLGDVGYIDMKTNRKIEGGRMRGPLKSMVKQPAVTSKFRASSS